MHPLDFINESPTFYILQKESIKTNLGGFFIVSYIIIMLAICIYYVIHYALDDKYVVNSLNHFNLKSNDEKRERDKNSLFNQNVGFILDIYHYDKIDDSLIKSSDKFKIVDKSQTINRNETFYKNITGFEAYICYECDNLNCSDYLDFVNNENNTDYYLFLSHQGFTLNHQHKNDPIQRKENGTEIFFSRLNGFKYNILNYYIKYNWKDIIYREKKYLSKNYEKSCGYVDGYFYDYIHNLITVTVKNKSYAILNNITFEIDYTKYLEYQRTRNSELDLVANIASLFSNVFFVARIIFKYYASHFNNFKIVEKILSSKHKIIITNLKKKKKSLELEDFLDENNNKFMPLNNDIGEVNERTSDSNENIKNEKEGCDDVKGGDVSIDADSIELKKLHFFDFFINNFYFDKCCKNKKSQNIINVCDKILCKYASIDTIVYNQLLLENLLKDYKWNDPKLNSVTNNNLFSELKAYL